MAIIDEYKQAIQDVMDGRAPKPPHPAEFPDTDDKLAAQYFAAAAFEKASDEASEALNKRVLIVTANTETIGGKNYVVLDKTFAEIFAAEFVSVRTPTANPGCYGRSFVNSVTRVPQANVRIVSCVNFGAQTVFKEFSASSDDDYPKYLTT